MLEITKIQYTEKPSATHPDATQITGGIAMYHVITAANREQVPSDTIKDEIAAHIWRKVYGELTQPLMELQTIASHAVLPEYYDRVRELCNQLNALLARKSPKDQAPPIAAKATADDKRDT